MIFSKFLIRLFGRKPVSPAPVVLEPPDEPLDVVDDPFYDIDKETDDDHTPRDPLPEPEAATLVSLEKAMVPIDPWRQRQQWLTDLGYSPGAIDGKPGPKTEKAILNFQGDSHLVSDGTWGPKTEKAVRDALKARLQPISPFVPPSPIFGLSKFEDMLGEVKLDVAFFASFEDLTSKSNVTDEKGRRRRKGVRKISALNRVCWHQTAFTWEPYRKLKALKKFFSHHKINAHVCFDTDGTILLLHPLTSYLWTANSFNPDCLSFEIMGNFEGVLGTANWYKPDKFGRARPQKIQLIRARQLTLWLTDPERGPPDEHLPSPLREWRLGVRALGRNPLKWVNTHRQATNDREIDCGSECWYHIMRWSIEKIDSLSMGPEAGKGMKIPLEWMGKPIVPPLT